MKDLREFLGFMAFLGVVLVVGALVAYFGTYIAWGILQLTGWSVVTIRWIGIVGVFGFAIIGLLQMQVERPAMFFFLAVALSAATWMGTVGLADVYAGWTQNHEITKTVVEAMFSFVFIIAGLIGALVNSGLYLKPQSN